LQKLPQVRREFRAINERVELIERKGITQCFRILWNTITDLNETNAVVAVDLEENTLFICGKDVKVRNKRTRKTRKRLQQKLSAHKVHNKDTRSLRRLLQRTRRKQQNRTKTFAQTTAKQLCQWAKPDSILVFEDLDMQQPQKGLIKGKSLRRRMSAWQRGLLRECVENKAQEYGLAICEIDPRYTSQDCSRCGLRVLIAILNYMRM
jgi:putative transposase